MKDLTNDFGNLYFPLRTLVIFKRHTTDSDYYVESYDMDGAGRPINGHPLTVKESNALAKALTVREKKAQGFLMPEALMPKNILHINSNVDGFAIWHTPAQERKLLFTESLGLPSGTAHVPTMIWKAHKGSVQVFAVKDEEITLHTNLYKAPFFNVYNDGRVCMGNVRIGIPSKCCLENFIALWEHHFYSSYFSHTIHGESPVKGNIVQLWQHLLQSGDPFPAESLLPTKYQLKNLIQ
jgi:PRTRC genetic system protein B